MQDENGRKRGYKGLKKDRTTKWGLVVEHCIC
jgi:hypothetical protein